MNEQKDEIVQSVLGTSIEESKGEGHGVENGEDGGNKWSDERPRKPEDDMVSYLQGVSGSLESALGDEEYNILLNNVFEEIQGSEASLACARSTCLILERLVRQASLSQISSMLQGIKTYFGFVAFNRQGSHVLQSILCQAFVQLHGKPSKKRKRRDEEEEEEEEAENESESEEQKSESTTNSSAAFQDLMCDLSFALINKDAWWDMMYDPSATHVLRALIALLAGVNPAHLVQTKASQQKPVVLEKKSVSPIPAFHASLHSFLAKMNKWEINDLVEICESKYAAPVMQLLLENCSSKHKAWRPIVEKLLGQDESKFADTFIQRSYERTASHTMQAIVKACDDTTFHDLFFSKCIKNKMLEYCQDSIANYVLQNALERLNSTEQFKAALKELGEEINKSMLYGKRGVIWKLCQAFCKAEKGLQTQLCRAVVHGVRATSRQKSKTVVEMLLQIRDEPGDVEENPDEENENNSYNNTTQVNILGARLVGALLKFSPESNRVVLQGIASMPLPSLKLCCTDSLAGRLVIESLMDAPPGAQWARQRVLQRLKPDLVALAENRYAWHMLRKAFDSGTLNDRLIIVRELSRHEKRLAGSRAGNNILKHCKVTLYRKFPDQWTTDQRSKKGGSSAKKRTLDTMLDDMDQAAIAVANAKTKKEKKKKKKLR